MASQLQFPPTGRARADAPDLQRRAADQTVPDLGWEVIQRKKFERVQDPRTPVDVSTFLMYARLRAPSVDQVIAATAALVARSADPRLWMGIEKTLGVAGGAACLVRTRIPVWTIENFRRLGWSDGKILENYPTLTAADLTAAAVYARAFRAEIETAIQENEAD